VLSIACDKRIRPLDFIEDFSKNTGGSLSLFIPRGEGEERRGGEKRRREEEEEETKEKEVTTLNRSLK